jgi:hypothetical protein
MPFVFLFGVCDLFPFYSEFEGIVAIVRRSIHRRPAGAKQKPPRGANDVTA